MRCPVCGLESVVDIVCGVLGAERQLGSVRRPRRWCRPAEIGVATRATLVDVFGNDGEFDVDSAFFQLAMAE